MCPLQTRPLALTRAAMALALWLAGGTGASHAQWLAPSTHPAPTAAAAAGTAAKVRTVITPAGLMLERDDLPAAAAVAKGALAPRVRAVLTHDGRWMQQRDDGIAPAPVAAGSAVGQAITRVGGTGQRLLELPESTPPAPATAAPARIVDLVAGPQGVVPPFDPQPGVLYRLVKPGAPVAKTTTGGG